MPIVLSQPRTDGLSGAVQALREWQRDGAPNQLHPGDIGWHWQFGAEEVAAAIRTWSRGDRILAVGLIDDPKLLRLGIAPDAQDDEELARQMLADVTKPGRGILPKGGVVVEARAGELLRTLLLDAGWVLDEPWAQFQRDLSGPVEDPRMEIEVVGPEHAHVRAAVQRAAFDRSTFNNERWHAMATGLPYAEARCLVAYDTRELAVAATTVWSAGPGRPGLLEPVGVDRKYRGRGYGRAITLAGTAALRALGSSSAIVSTPSTNTAAVATYRSAGFKQLPDVRDLRRR